MHDRGVVRGIAADELVDARALDAEVARIEVVLLHRAARDLPHVAVPGGRQLVEPVVAAEDERGRAAGLEHADDERHAVEMRDADRRRLGAGGVAERAEEVEDRRHAELGAHGPRVLEAGVEGAREREGDADLAEHLARRAPRAATRSRPSAASTSDDPDDELAARLPCLITGTPDAAATTDAIVDTFTVPNRSPPVPTMSSAIGSTGSGTACSSTASRKPTISSTVSPFTRSAMRNPASCAWVTVPVMTCSMHHAASDTLRSSPSSSEEMMVGQVCSAGMHRS